MRLTRSSSSRAPAASSQSAIPAMYALTNVSHKLARDSRLQVESQRFIVLADRKTERLSISLDVHQWQAARPQQSVDSGYGVGNVAQQSAIPVPDDVVVVAQMIEKTLHLHASTRSPARALFLSAELRQSRLRVRVAVVSGLAKPCDGSISVLRNTAPILIGESERHLCEHIVLVRSSATGLARSNAPARPDLETAMNSVIWGDAMATLHTRSAARLMIAPSVLLLLAWMIVPLAMTIYFSFLRYNLLMPGHGRASSGFSNYITS